MPPLNRDETLEEIFKNMSSLRRLLFSSGPAHGSLKGLPSRAQLGVLMLVAHKGPQSIKELAQCFGVSPSAVSQLVDGLVEDELIKREEDKENRRKIAVSLTLRGKHKLKQVEAVHMKSVARIFSSLNNKELSQFNVLQSKIVEGLK
jgi:DNA-binding MarR family transcriptional regulator